MIPSHNETPPGKGDVHRVSWHEFHKQDTKRTGSSQRPPSTTRLRSLRLIGLPRSLEGSPDLIAAWVRCSGTQRRHILNYVNPQDHLPPWAMRDLDAMAEPKSRANGL